MAFGKPRHIKATYKSGLEEQTKGHLESLGVPFEYEAFRIPYVSDPHRYTPDFTLPNGIIVETKGLFDTKDRTKHLLVQRQHPTLDIRFVFTRSSTRISKVSKTTYADWCRKFGFQFADKTIPDAWIAEAPNPVALAAIQALKQTTTTKRKGKAC